MKSIAPSDIDENTFKLIGDDWMLIAAGNSQSYNMMTASWGGFGILWGKPVVYIFIRPSRYTFQFVEEQETFSLNFFTEKYRKTLNFCGSKSGRNVNKMVETGLTPVETEGALYFAESKLSVECKKLYYQDLIPDQFLTNDIEKHYHGKDYHRMYIGEVTRVHRQ